MMKASVPVTCLLCYSHDVRATLMRNDGHKCLVCNDCGAEFDVTVIPVYKEVYYD